MMQHIISFFLGYTDIISYVSLETTGENTTKGNYKDQI